MTTKPMWNSRHTYKLPVKENDEIEKRNNRNRWKCPHCGAQVHRTFMPHYCGQCGGAIDWRNT